MKKIRINPNILLFCAVFAFIILAFGAEMRAQVKDGGLQMLKGVLSLDFESVDVVRNNIDSKSQEWIEYHQKLMDLDSIKERIIGKKVIFKNDSTVLLTKSGKLCFSYPKVSEIEVDLIAENVRKLQEVSLENGANFLYCYAPCKGEYETFPINFENYSVENRTLLLEAFEERGIQYLNLANEFSKRNMAEENLFFNTDHHWTIQTAFEAYRILCENLQSRFGFSYNLDYANLENYNIETLPDFSLGSLGKKAGSYYCPYGLDDFDVITPKFETNLTESLPLKGEERIGSFDETVLFKDRIEKKNLDISTYAAYSGGEFRLQIVKNNLLEDGKKVLLIRDSFAGAVMPFLSLQVKEIHVCDTRTLEYIYGDKINFADYIQEYNPDYVIVLYNGVQSIEDSEDLYNFFP